MASAVALAYNGGLGAEPPARSRGRAPGQGVRGLPWIWISMDISMDIMLAHLLIKLYTYMFCLSMIFFVRHSYSSFCRLFTLLSQMNNQ